MSGCGDDGDGYGSGRNSIASSSIRTLLSYLL